MSKKRKRRVLRRAGIETSERMNLALPAFARRMCHTDERVLSDRLMRARIVNGGAITRRSRCPERSARKPRMCADPPEYGSPTGRWYSTVTRGWAIGSTVRSPGPVSMGSLVALKPDSSVRDSDCSSLSEWQHAGGRQAGCQSLSAHDHEPARRSRIDRG